MSEPIDSDAASEIPDVEKAASFTWALHVYQQRGNLWLSWKTTAPFRAQQGQIHVYDKNFPSNPQAETKKWSWDTEHGGGTGWDSGLPWGSGWHCAWIAEKSPNGPYTYVVQVVT